MSKMPEEGDMVGFILASGGLGRAVLRLVARDGIKSLANLTFWGLLAHFLFLHAYMGAILIAVPISTAYFLYLAFAPGVESQARHGAVVSLFVVAILLLVLAYFWWRDRPPK